MEWLNGLVDRVAPGINQSQNVPKSVRLPRYSHIPLRNDHEFRLLTLLPGEGDDPICIRLNNVDFHSNIKYCALSFDYGSTDNNKDVIVKKWGKLTAIEVTYNCYQALHQIRESNTEFPLWVSSICINQATGTNEERREKSIQLGLMSYIYPKAYMVLCWLGDGDDTTELAIQTLERWATAGQAADRQNDRLRLQLLRQTQEDIRHKRWETTLALERFFDRPWFERMWIVQEVCVGFDKSPLLMCGHHRLCFHILYKAFLTMMNTMSYQFRTLASGLTVENILPLLQFYGARQSLMKLSHIIPSLSNRKYTLPQDAIYGTLGLAARYTPGYPPPDVSLTADQVCVRYTRAMMRVDNCLDILYCVSTAHHPHSNLPSWAVKWYQLRPDSKIFLQREDFCAASEKPVELGTQGPDDNELKLRGAVIDCIEREFDITELLQTLSTIRQWKMLRQEIGRFIDDTLQQHLDQRYGSNRLQWVEIVMRTLCADSFVLDHGSQNLKHSAIEPLHVQYLDSLQYSLDKRAIMGDSQPSQPILTFDQFRSYLQTHFSFRDSTPDGTVDESLYHLLDNTITGTTVSGKLQEGRRLVITRYGFLGLAPGNAQVGSDICLLYGSHVPMVLRPTPSNKYTLVGGIYVHGMMHGQGLSQAEANESWICLI